MIPKEVLQTVESVGEAVHIANFNATDETMPRILVDLSDKMYNQKELACVREYSTNAADAMVKAGKSIADIQIHIPTYESLTFRIRDFGSGLSENDITQIYCVLGKSDKRNTNLYNGMFGYGCKAGFAHADSFTVTSWNNGTKTVYNCVKGDTTKLHSVYRLSCCPSDEPSGIEVAIPVKQSSMWTFHSVAAEFFKYWETMPTLNGLGESYKTKMEVFRNSAPTLVGEGWEVRAGGGSPKGVAFMGYVAYPINWDILYQKLALTQKTRALFELLKSNNVTLFFNIGDVTFVNNREGLEYTEETIQALTGRIESIFAKIQDSIQAKFTPCTNLWEAKMMYNSIFGTGVVEMESGESEDAIEKIRILDGNLMKLEQTFEGVFTWNGISIGGPYFKKINRFDNVDPSVVHGDLFNPSAPVMVTYRKKNKRVKVNRCNGDKNNGITASLHVAVVINDLGTRTGVQQVARYLVFQANSKIKVVHVLNFESESLKHLFYQEYHFDSVPVLKLSDLIGPARVWNNANKTSRSYKGGGNGGSGSGSRMMRYIDVAKGTVEESDIPVREMEDGSYFIKVGQSKGAVELACRVNEEVSSVADALHTVVEQLGMDLDRVYIITKQTSESKWFKQAVDCGDWLPVWDYVKENLGAADPVTLLTVEKFADNSMIGISVATEMKDRIYDKNSPILEVIGMTNVITNYESNLQLVKALQTLWLWDDFVGTNKPMVDFSKKWEDIMKRYPLLDELSHHEIRYGNIKENKLESVIRYINAIDLWIDMAVAEPTPVKQTA